MSGFAFDMSFRDVLIVLCIPLVGLGFIAAAVHAAAMVGILPSHSVLSGVTDDRVLAYKSRACRSKHPARVLLIGDSSCMTGIDSTTLSRLLPGQARVLNLGLILGLGFDVYGEAAADFLRNNPDQVNLVVLLVTPGKLSEDHASPHHQQLWRRLSLESAHVAKSDARLWERLTGRAILKGVFSRTLSTPGQGVSGQYYGFASGVSDYLQAHDGSMVDPGRFRKPSDYGRLLQDVHPAVLEECQRLRRCIPRAIPFVAGLMPVPSGLYSAEDARERGHWMDRWNQALDADILLTNLPVYLPDSFFASGAHLNQMGQQYFTRLLGRELATLQQPREPSSSASLPVLQSCSLTNGSIYFGDSKWSNHPRRLYRIRSP